MARQIIVRLLILQAGVLSVLVVVTMTGLHLSGEMIAPDSTVRTIALLRDAVVRDQDGRLVILPNDELDSLRRDVPGTWYQIRDRADGRITVGEVPPEYEGIGEALNNIGQARMGWSIGDSNTGSARMNWVESQAGPVQVVTGSSGPVATRWFLLVLVASLASMVVPLLTIMALATFVVTPWVVKRALGGLKRAADEAERIDVDRRGGRLSNHEVPSEITPFVDAINAALERLDSGYTRHQRFLADAAHELRTPIAILRIRLDALADSAEKRLLIRDTDRLAHLAKQLLHTQRLSLHTERVAIDLVALCGEVLSDAAPLAIESGYQLALNATEPFSTIGDRWAIERVLVNLIHNAIEHSAGSRIIVHVSDGMVQVEDDGVGIPIDLRERVFEPFFRATPNGRGAGLGLYLVRQMMRMHGGDATLLDGPASGTHLRLTFPRSHRAIDAPDARLP